MNCPLCGCQQAYQGLNSVECVSPDCDNWDRVARESPSLDGLQEALRDLEVNWPWPV